MKKIYYLLALLPLAFTACQKEPLVPANSLTKTGTLTFTLAPADYQLLPSSDYPYSSNNFNSISDANLYIPMILTAKESSLLNNGSTATVTYALAPASLKVADSLYSDVAYTVTSADYFAVTGNHYGDFSASDVLNFLAYKYPAAVANQLAVISYTLYTGVDTPVVNSFLYLNGAWILIYQVTPAQYTLVGEGKYDQFTAADVSKLPGYFNFFLKNDITIADTARANDVEYVSYGYYASGNYQKVLALTYDGNNWGAISVQVTGSFLKKGGAWTPVLPVPTINHTLTAADVALIAASNVAPSTLLSNLGKYGDFETSWTTAELDAAFILVLTTDYPTPVVGDNYVITYLLYTGGADVPTQLTFQYSGTAWVAK
jgi:hypothetical protein